MSKNQWLQQIAPYGTCSCPHSVPTRSSLLRKWDVGDFVEHIQYTEMTESKNISEKQKTCLVQINKDTYGRFLIKKKTIPFAIA